MPFILTVRAALSFLRLGRERRKRTIARAPARAVNERMPSFSSRARGSPARMRRALAPPHVPVTISVKRPQKSRRRPSRETRIVPLARASALAEIAGPMESASKVGQAALGPGEGEGAEAGPGGAPRTSRAKTLRNASLSSLLRLSASESKATKRPSPEIDGL